MRMMELLESQWPVGDCGRGSMSTSVSADSPSSDAPRHSLGFILNEPHAHNVIVQAGEAASNPLQTRSYTVAPIAESAPRNRSSGSRLRSQAKRPATAHPEATSASAGPTRRRTTASQSSLMVKSIGRKPLAATTAGAARTAKSTEEKRKSRQCKVVDCNNYTINRGLCFRHGGGKRCAVSDCNASGKINGVCWKHGGSVQCTVIGCDRRAKSRGLCWHHGGGTLCEEDDCKKVAVSNGRCWAHGGGKRCLYEGCERPAYERTLNYCPRHFERYEKGEDVLEV